MGVIQELPIAAPPGVVKNNSLRAIEGRWSDTINARFVGGLPQKIGGWEQAFDEETSGVPRALHAWRDLTFNAFMAAGTYRKLYVYDQNLAQNDITPFRDEGTLGTDPLSVVSGSNVVTVDHTGHGLSAGDIAYITGATAVGGITPNMPDGVAVNTVIDANTYTYLFTSNATSTATGGGSAVDYQYEVPIGTELGAYGYGWGVGGWGLGTWGTARDESTVSIEPRVWSLDHFGVLLLSAYNGGSIYQFDPTDAQPWGRATLVSADPGLPTNVRAMFVTPERFVFALCEGMQVKWPSQGTIDDWTPSATNTANIRTLAEGTKLVGGRVLSEFVSLVWTDSALYRFQYTGATYVYSSAMVAKDCGLISPNAAVTVGGIAYWQGQDNFWQFTGSVMPMKNVEDIRRWVFDNLDINLGYQCNASYNPKYNEVWFFFTILGETSPTLGAIYSIDQGCWAPLYWGRASGTHFTQGDTRPYFGDSNSIIYQHEVGYDAAGSALAYSWTLAPYGLTKGGRRNMMAEYLVWDAKDQVGDVTLTVTSYDRLNDSAVLETESETMAAEDSGTIDLRISGRYIAVAMGGNSAGCYARFGLPVAFVRSIGERT